MKLIYSKLLSKQKNIIHTYTTREEGNLAYHVNDDKNVVNKNHLQLSDLLKYPVKNLVHMKQVHGNKIIKVTKELKEIPICDALITDKKNIPLMVMVADCIPILIYDPINKAIAAIHAGRTGVFQKILPKTINKMKKEYKSKEKDLMISLGPSIHSCCYEVGEEILKETKELNIEYSIKETDSKLYLDLISIIRQQLKNIPKTNIEISSICTVCNNDTVFSYRKDKECGRFAGIIMLK